VPAHGEPSADDREMLDAAHGLLPKVRDAIDRQLFHEALEAIWVVIRAANGYVDRQAPWALRKTDPARMGTVLWVLAETIRNLALLTQPFMPAASARLLDLVAVPADARSFAFCGSHHALKPGTALPVPQGVFPRFVDEEAAS
jgi:methionyl-tRNA synthetase